MTAKTSGQSRKSIKPWKYYESMLFIKDATEGRSTISNILQKTTTDDGYENGDAADGGDEGEGDDDEELDGETQAEVIAQNNESTQADVYEETPQASGVPISPKPVISYLVRKKREKDDKDERMVKLAEKLAEPLPVPQIVNTKKEDHITLFLRSLEPSMRALSSFKQSYAEIKLQTILHEMSFGDEYPARTHNQGGQNAPQPHVWRIPVYLYFHSFRQLPTQF